MKESFLLFLCTKDTEKVGYQKRMPPSCAALSNKRNIHSSKGNQVQIGYQFPQLPDNIIHRYDAYHIYHIK